MAWSEADVRELYLRVRSARAKAEDVQASARRIVPGVRTERLLLERRYGSSQSSIGLAREEAARYATRSGATEAQVHAIRLAVSEAVTNAVVHAYPNGSGTIYLTASRTSRELSVIVCDDGVGPRHAPATERSASGWMIMASAADKFTVTARGEGGTLVELRWTMTTSSAPVAAMARG